MLRRYKKSVSLLHDNDGSSLLYMGGWRYVTSEFKDIGDQDTFIRKNMGLFLAQLLCQYGWLYLQVNGSTPDMFKQFSDTYYLLIFGVFLHGASFGIVYFSKNHPKFNMQVLYDIVLTAGNILIMSFIAEKYERVKVYQVIMISTMVFQLMFILLGRKPVVWAY